MSRTGLFALVALTALLAAAVMPVYASTTGIVSGVVTDAGTGAKLSGVNVAIKGTNLTTVTDAGGYFVITNVPPGAYEVTASLVGYGDASKSDVQVMMDATSASDISLTKKELVEKQAVVVGTRRLTQPAMAPTLYMVSSRQETMERNQPNNLFQIPGTVGTQPGITLGGDGRPHIRGGRDNEIGYMLEGIPVTEPLTTVFGTNMVTVGMSRMQVYTGGYRAEYGNAISGVLNEIKKTGSEAPGTRLDVSGGEQSYKGSYLEVGGAAPSGLDYYVGSYLWKSAFEKMMVAGTDSADTVGKFVYPKGNDKWTLLVNQGSARYYLDAVHDLTFMRQPVTPEDDHTHQGYDILGLTWSHNFSPSSFITVRPYQFHTKAVVDALSPTGPMGVYIDYGTRQQGLQAEYTNQVSESHLLKAGASLIRSKNRYMYWVPDLGAALGHPEWGDYYYNSNVTTAQTGAFLQDQASFGKKWHAEMGLRYDGMHFDKVANPDVTESQVSPRLGMTYALNDRNVLKATWGRFIQYPPTYVMERIYANPGWEEYRVGSVDLKPERSASWDFSWERQLNDWTLARITPFHRTYTDLLQSQRGTPTDPTSMSRMYVNSGRGKSDGVEFYVSRKMSKGWEGWLSYTWMKARANASSFTSSIDPTVWTYVDWDQRHTVNLVLARRYKDWEHNFQLYFGSGLADSVTVRTAQYQGHAHGPLVLSWNVLRKLPKGSSLGDQVYLNIWNILNTSQASHYFVYPDGSKEPDSWIAPRFISLGVIRKF